MRMLRIKYELISRGISQTEFAKSAGLKPQAVCRIVNGLEPPYAKRGQRIAAALGWEGNPSELFEEVDVLAEAATPCSTSSRTAPRVIVADEETDCATGYCACGACGEPIDPWDRFCRWCGARMEDA